VYNASNNELVRTKTLVKNAIVTIDATPFRQWYEAHYALPLGRKKGAKLVSVCLIIDCCGVGVLVLQL
jgi:small subunit ribosomal protein S8e